MKGTYNSALRKLREKIRECNVRPARHLSLKTLRNNRQAAHKQAYKSDVAHWAW